MKDRRAQAHKRSCQQQHRIAGRIGQQNQTKQRGHHAAWQPVRLGALVGIKANQGLKQRGCELIDQRNQAHLAKAQMKVALEHGVHGQNQRLHHVVDHV